MERTSLSAATFGVVIGVLARPFVRESPDGNVEYAILLFLAFINAIVGIVLWQMRGEDKK